MLCFFNSVLKINAVNQPKKYDGKQFINNRRYRFYSKYGKRTHSDHNAYGICFIPFVSVNKNAFPLKSTNSSFLEFSRNLYVTNSISRLYWSSYLYCVILNNLHPHI